MMETNGFVSSNINDGEIETFDLSNKRRANTQRINTTIVLGR